MEKVFYKIHSIFPTQEFKQIVFPHPGFYFSSMMGYTISSKDLAT